MKSGGAETVRNMKPLRALMRKLQNITENRRVCKAAFLLIVTGQLLLALFWMTQRENYFLDELYSFGHAQSYFSSDPSDKDYLYDSPLWKAGTWIDNRDLKDRLEISGEESAFSQPPMKAAKKLLTGRNYHGILNILLSAFTAGRMSPYPGTVFNMVFLLFTQILLYRITREITGNTKAALLAVLMYGFSAMALDMTLYVRFYTFAIFLVMAAIRIHQIMWRTEKLWQCEALTVAAMALFYFAVRNSELTLVLSGALAGCYALGLLGRKQVRKTACYLITVIPVGLVYLLRKTRYLDIILHPENFTQDFWPLRDMADSVVALNGKGLLLTAKRLLKQISKRLFGSRYLLLCFAVIVLVLLCVRLLRRGTAEKPATSEQREKAGFFWVVFGVAAIYLAFAILTSLPSLFAPRYCSYLYPLICLLLWAALAFLTEKEPFRNAVVFACSILTVCGIILQQVRADPDYIYLGDGPAIRSIRDTGIRDSVVVFGEAEYAEFQIYDCVVLMPETGRIYPIDGAHTGISADGFPDEMLIWSLPDTDISPYVRDLTSGGYRIAQLGTTHASDVYTARRHSVPAS